MADESVIEKALRWMENPQRTQQMQGMGSSIRGALQKLIDSGEITKKAARDTLRTGQLRPNTPAQAALDSGMVEAAMQLGPQAIVWHGSPHKFDKFDSSKIGTGEGAQAYGHGLYLAENKNVADEYATKLSKSIVDFTNSPSNPTEIAIQKKLQSIADTTQTGNKLDAVNRVFDSYLYPSLTTWNPKHPQANSYNGMAPIDGENLSRVMELRDAARKLGRTELWDSGSLYKVDLPDDAIEKMLDWDKPVSEQPINDFLRSIGWNARSESTRGKDLYDRMVDVLGGQSSASDTLSKVGIPGIRYLDGGSRGTGAGTSNFVVFPGNENLLTILERNGQKLEGFANGGVVEEPQIRYSPERIDQMSDALYNELFQQ